MLVLHNNAWWLEGQRSECERRGDKNMSLAHILEGSLGRCKGKLRCALDVLNCDCDDDNDNINKDDDDNNDDWVALVGPVIGAAGMMGDSRWDSHAG